MVVRAKDLAAEGFNRVVKAIQGFIWRSEITIEQIGSPQRIAPFSYAMEAELGSDDAELGSGRLVLLHDPAGNETWDGQYRLVSLVRADTDLAIVTDALIGEVGWSWLTDALAEHDARYTAPSGTVTSVSSRSFGAMDDEEDQAELEIRASWTPLLEQPDDITQHLRAWQQLMCNVAGLPPLAEGIVSLGPRLVPR